MVRSLLLGAGSELQMQTMHRALPDAMALAKAFLLLLHWAHRENPVLLEELLLKFVVPAVTLPAKPTVAAACLRQHIRQRAAAKQAKEEGRQQGMAHAEVRHASHFKAVG